MGISPLALLVADWARPKYLFLMQCNFILYVRDQEAATRFYRSVLGQAPVLHVPGMTEFRLGDEFVLGLMPEKGIKRLLGSAIPDPERTSGAARAEVYLTVQDPEGWLQRAVEAGAKLLAPVAPRDWGDDAGYVCDLDGHVLAFASKGKT